MAIQDEIPRSRITLTYRTTINGEQETINLPLRLMVLGDFSLGSSDDRQRDLEERAPRSINGRNLDSVMKDMKMNLRLTVPNRINPAKEESLAVDLPISKMQSFAPEEVARHVPKVRALLLLKTLLNEMQSNIDNRKELRKLIQEIFANPEAFRAVQAELKGFEGHELPSLPPSPAAESQ